MLKGKLIHPDLIAALALCGHGDKVLIADGNYPLDSKTGAQVLDILHQLHREQGTTVLRITHDNKVAAAARRIIRIADGQIVVDCPREEIAL